MAQATLKPGLPTLVLAPERAREAALIEGLEVAVVERLASAVRVLGRRPRRSAAASRRGQTPSRRASWVRT